MTQGGSGARLRQARELAVRRFLCATFVLALACERRHELPAGSLPPIEPIGEPAGPPGAPAAWALVDTSLAQEGAEALLAVRSYHGLIDALAPAVASPGGERLSELLSDCCGIGSLAEDELSAFGLDTLAPLTGTLGGDDSVVMRLPVTGHPSPLLQLPRAGKRTTWAGLRGAQLAEDGDDLRFLLGQRHVVVASLEKTHAPLRDRAPLERAAATLARHTPEHALVSVWFPSSDEPSGVAGFDRFLAALSRRSPDDLWSSGAGAFAISSDPSGALVVDTHAELTGLSKARAELARACVLEDLLVLLPGGSATVSASVTRTSELLRTQAAAPDERPSLLGRVMAAWSLAGLRAPPGSFSCVVSATGGGSPESILLVHLPVPEAAGLERVAERLGAGRWERWGAFRGWQFSGNACAVVPPAVLACASPARALGLVMAMAARAPGRASRGHTLVTYSRGRSSNGLKVFLGSAPELPEKLTNRLSAVIRDVTYREDLAMDGVDGRLTVGSRDHRPVLPAIIRILVEELLAPPTATSTPSPVPPGEPRRSAPQGRP